MKICLDTIEKVKRFVEVANRFEDAIALSSGRFLVDGKSILGIFSMDLRQPLDLPFLHRFYNILHSPDRIYIQNRLG